MAMNLSSSCTRCCRRTTNSRRASSSSFTPACSISSTKFRLLPSATGGSAESISMMQLSICNPFNADNTCSTVNTFASPSSSVVARIVLVTLDKWAFTDGRPGKSVRMNTMPVLAGAGHSTMWTSSAACRPIPLYDTDFAKVVCATLDINMPSFLLLEIT